jgi:hypothetical protein
MFVCIHCCKSVSVFPEKSAKILMKISSVVIACHLAIKTSKFVATYTSNLSGIIQMESKVINSLETRKAIRERYGSDTGAIRERYGSDTGAIRERYGSDTGAIRERQGFLPSGGND